MKRLQAPQPDRPADVLRAERRLLRLLLVGVTVAMLWVLLPFYGAILWAAILALLFRPLHCWLLVRVPHPTWAALMTMTAALVVVVLPTLGVMLALAREAGQLYDALQSGRMDPASMLRQFFDALPATLRALLGRFGIIDFDTLRKLIGELLTQASGLIASQTLSIGQNALHLSIGVFITVYLGFFLVRDGEALMVAVRRALPLPAAAPRDLLDEFGGVLRATVKSNLAVAVVQGTLGGLAFWVLGVQGALLWAVVMAVLSLLPVVGASLVWAPLALWLVASGSPVEGIGLVLYGVLVIGLVDNLLRPRLVGKDTGMPDYLVMISTFGGIAVLGMNGFVVGPAVAAIFIAVWRIQSANTNPVLAPGLDPGPPGPPAESPAGRPAAQSAELPGPPER